MIKYRSMLFFLLWNVGNVFGQAQPQLTIGDTVPPDLVLDKLINTNSGRITLADLKGKAIIFDFGTTACGPCIESALLLDSLQRQFPDELAVFFVSLEKEQRVRGFLAANKFGKRIRMPVAFEDTVLHQWFKHVTEPHEVWIDKDLQVKAFTDHHYLTQEHIRALISGAELNWPVKWDFEYDYNQPIWKMDSVNVNPISRPVHWQRAFVSGHMKGIGWRRFETREGGQIRMTVMNYPLMNMYLLLYKRSLGSSINLSQLELKGVSINDLMYGTDGNLQWALWKEKNTYCYEMVYPETLPEAERNKRTINYLNAYFGYRTGLKKVMKTCWILKGNKPIPNIKLKEEGMSLSQLIRMANNRLGVPVFFDETALPTAYKKYGLKVVVSLGALSDLKLLNKELRPYNLHVEEKKREVEIFEMSKIN